MENINVNLDETKEAVNSLKSKDYSDNKQQYNETEAKIIKQKVYIRNNLMPDNKQEDERIKEIASKLSSHIKVAFDEFDNMDEVIDYLTPTFQRGKVDKAYGRALLLMEENTLIEQVKVHFDDHKINAKLMDYILTELIELSNEIMPNEYSEILTIERSYFELLYSDN
ncbi:hypothetical protein M4L90_08375 [Staphylococcus equorum]|uniref:Uncharacterized protein n=1 Tax=Staphylococcus equorum TaxID=246432 RepID=A0A9X4L5Q7_9STAP|nr:hypothetical protein [Staphylococcus equorum]MDG0820172.1 hypothetical protein [Staphylococcus equorum]MDG0840555.1 hypothetical protein [Staphylococcus equorum]MDG0846496.1 hypothetical protein [Staphylococcus equorum]